MTNGQSATVTGTIGVSLVDGEAGVRHARQLMLRSEHYEVRSYATCDALLDDPRSRDYPCIILDVASDDIDGVDLLRRMRASGWRGKAILLDGDDPGGALLADVERHGDKVMKREIGDRTLLNAIEAAVENFDRKA
jgi:FixJ family two-component response regulator